MPEEQRLTSDVLRRNSIQECGQPVGQLHIKINNSVRPFETVSFYCTEPKGHLLTPCRFVGSELIITRKSQ